MGEYSYTMTTSIVGTDDGRETYEIRRTFDVEGKSAVLIALYPTVSLLNPIKMDSSTMYLLNHMHELGYNDIRIVNLFSKVFERKPSLKQLRESQDNISHIESLLDKVKADSMDIIIAWGLSMKRNKLSNEIKLQILEMIRDKGLEKYVKELTSVELEQETLCPHMLWMGLHCQDTWITRPVKIDTILEDMGETLNPVVKEQPVKRKRGRKKKLQKEANETVNKENTADEG